MGVAFPMSECKGSTATGPWILPYSPGYVGQDLRGDKNVSRMSPAPPIIKPGLGIFLWGTLQMLLEWPRVVQSVAEQKSPSSLSSMNRCVVVVEKWSLIFKTSL